MVSPFPVSPPKIPYPILPLHASMRVLPQPPNYSCLPALVFPYTGTSSLHRKKKACLPIDIPQSNPLLHMWLEPCMESLHLYSLVIGLVSGNSGWGVWLFDIIVLPTNCKPLQVLQSFL